jgi:hypothetical protein
VPPDPPQPEGQLPPQKPQVRLQIGQPLPEGPLHWRQAVQLRPVECKLKYGLKNYFNKFRDNFITLNKQQKNVYLQNNIS